MRNALVGFKPNDINKVLENVVINHLLQMEYAVSVGKINDFEIDFIAEKQNKKVYIQVAYLLSDNGVIEREFGNLQKIKDSYPKFVVSMDQLTIDNYDGIHHVNLLEFLLKEQLD